MNIEQNLKHICLGIINKIEDNEELKTIEGFTKEAEVFRERLNDDEIRIAVVGEFSSGKSTFINALIGKDILNHATKETTAVITRLINVKKSSKECNTGEVIFKNGTIKKIDNLRNLKEYTSTFSTTYDVINQIKNVNIYVSILNIKEQIVLIDTPGLNGIADGHREQTIELIKNAHFCIYLLQRKGLSNTDIEFLNYIKQYQNNFIIIQNFIDTFNKIEGEYVEDKLKEQEKILKEKIFKENGFIYSLCGVSAWQELVSQDKNIEKYEDNSSYLLTNNDRKIYHEKSGFDEYRRCMSKLINEKTIDKIKYGSTAWAIYQWLDRINEIVDIRKKDAELLYDLSKEKDSYDKIEKLIKKIKTNKSKVKQQLTNFIISECRGMKNKEKKKISESFCKLENDIYRNIDIYNDLDKLEKYHENLSKILKQKLDELQDVFKEECNLYITNLYQMVIMRVEEYSGLNDKNIEYDNFKTNLQKENIQAYTNSINKINELGKEYDERKKDIIKFRNIYDEINSEIIIVNKDVKNLKNREKDIEKWKSKKILELGAEPKIELITKTRKVKRKGVLGFFGNIILGDKTEYYTEKDSSNRDAWRKKIYEIESRYKENIADLQSRQKAQERRLKRLKENERLSKERLGKIEQELLYLNEEIERKENLLAQEKKYAKLELLKKNQKKIKMAIKKYLFEQENNVYDVFIENIEKNIDNVQKQLTIEAINLYDKSVKIKLDKLETSKEDYTWDKQVKNIFNLALNINKWKKELEAYI